jgi:UPF0489 domain
MSGTTAGEWLVPFKGRHPSNAYNQNFLWKTGNVYIMDNHRAALWCWMQHVERAPPHSLCLMHIDRHFDTLQSNMQTWLPHYPNTWDMSISQYLDLSYKSESGREHFEVFRFDNYLSLYLSKTNAVASCWFATHDDGDKPNFEDKEDVAPWDLLQNLDWWVESGRSQWIMNIDLDYFFCDDSKDNITRMLSDDYIAGIFSAVRKTIDAGHVAVTTIALSPEFCGGWEPSERALKVGLTALGIDFKVP